MKIIPGSQQAALAAETAEKTEKTASPSKQPAAAKPSLTTDQVEFSASLGIGLKAQQDQAERVAALKSLVKSGNYQVSSQKVAEKMLSSFPDF
jgi:negative regulator of flagellin synthesis FlgM